MTRIHCGPHYYNAYYIRQPWLSAVGELVGLPWRKARYSSLGSGPPQRETPIREIRGVAEAATLPEV
ncbi:hypothetical protein HZH68_004276 [Vespula germanica]|uniref:Uncharacterized protein n=1 Tax=Vespula germanica TaxID=30212 RepID=A0A834NI43_VESGE|nr:hypothetical protein HZH68_004276 [Vespula germanica]